VIPALSTGYWNYQVLYCGGISSSWKKTKNLSKNTKKKLLLVLLLLLRSQPLFSQLELPLEQGLLQEELERFPIQERVTKIRTTQNLVFH